MTNVKNNSVQKVVIYGRAGSEKALGCQLHRLEEYAMQQGWSVSEVYTDIASSRVRNRAGLSRLTADALNSEFDTILTEDLARLFRGREFAPEIYKHLLSGEIGLCTTDGLCTVGGNSLMMLSLGVLFHQNLLINHGRRIAFAKRQQKNSGV